MQISSISSPNENRCTLENLILNKILAQLQSFLAVGNIPVVCRIKILALIRRLPFEDLNGVETEKEIA